MPPWRYPVSTVASALGTRFAFLLKEPGIKASQRDAIWVEKEQKII